MQVCIQQAITKFFQKNGIYSIRRLFKSRNDPFSVGKFLKSSYFNNKRAEYLIKTPKIQTNSL